MRGVNPRLLFKIQTFPSKRGPSLFLANGPLVTQHVRKAFKVRTHINHSRVQHYHRLGIISKLEQKKLYLLKIQKSSKNFEDPFLLHALTHFAAIFVRYRMAFSPFHWLS